MLLKSIEHHIQDAGKALLKNDEGKQNPYINKESGIFNILRESIIEKFIFAF